MSKLEEKAIEVIKHITVCLNYDSMPLESEIRSWRELLKEGMKK